MQAGKVFRAAIVLMLAMAPCAHADPFLAKPGAWEVNGNTTFEPNEHNAARRQKMTAAQRAEEDRQLVEMAKTRTSKICFSKKEMELDEIAAIDDRGGKCTVKNVSKSPTRVVSEKVCPDFTGTYSLEASSPESMKMQIVLVYPEKGTLRVEGQGRWVGESCADVPK